MSKHEMVHRPMSEVLASLPTFCFARLPSDGSPIRVVRGEHGYSPAPLGMDVDMRNAALGVTPAQREAMVAGSMFGFDVPGADPLNYPDTVFTADKR